MAVINSQILYGGIDVTDYAALSFGCMYKNISGSTSIGVSTELDSPQQRTTLPTAEEIKQPLKSDDGENGGDDADDNTDDNTICMSTTTTERRRRATTTAENQHMHNDF